MGSMEPLNVEHKCFSISWLISFGSVLRTPSLDRTDRIVDGSTTLPVTADQNSLRLCFDLEFLDFQDALLEEL